MLADWGYRVQVTINSSHAGGIIGDFPVSVNLSAMPAGFWNNINTDGSDIRVTTSDGDTLVPIEISTIDAVNNRGRLYFKGAISNTANTIYYVYFGNASATAFAVTDTYGRNNVWVNQFNTRAVFHTDGHNTSTVTDSTGNGFTGTITGNPSTTIDATMGRVLDLNGTSQWISIPGAIIDRTTSYSVSTHVYSRSTTSSRQCFMGLWGTMDGGKMRKLATSGQWEFSEYSGTNNNLATTTAPTNNTWHHHVGTRSKTNLRRRAYVDGILVNSASTSPDPNAITGAVNAIGARSPDTGMGATVTEYSNILASEFRVYNAEISAEWVTAEHNNLNNQTSFLSVGVVETIPNGIAITITASNQSKTYGQTLSLGTSAWTVTSGTVEAGDITGITLSSTGAANTADAGTYNIIPSSATGPGVSKYSITYINGTLTVGKKNLTVITNNKSITYGSTSPTFDVSYSGFENGDTYSVLDNTEFVLSSTYTRGNSVGTYPINISLGTATDVNYNFTPLTPGTLTVTKKTLEVIANNKNIVVNSPVPTLDVSYSGFYGSDTSATLDNTGFILSTTYVQGSAIGTYPITISAGTATDNNYNFTPLTSGVLTVTSPEDTWTYRIPITVNSSSVGGMIGEFPIMFNLGSMPSGFFNNVKNDGSDIRVTKSDGLIEVPIEVSSIDKINGRGKLYFKGSVSNSENTIYYIYFGNPSANAYEPTNPLGRNAVWTNQFTPQAVYHLDGHDNIIVYDSTGHGHNGTINNNIPTAFDVNVGNVLNFNGTNHWIGNQSSIIPRTEGFSISLYLNSRATTASRQCFFGLWGSMDGGKMRKLATTGEFQMGDYNGNNQNITTPTSPTNNTWQHFVCTKSITNVRRRLYLGGAQVQADTVVDAPNEIVDGYNAIGARTISTGSTFDLSEYADMLVSEVRVYSDELTPEWVATEYNNLHNTTTFFNIGDIEQVTSGIAITITVSNQNKTYGENKILGTTEWNITSGVLDDEGDITGITLTSTGAVSTSNAGVYNIVGSSAVGPGASKYTITYVNGTLTVGKKNLSVSANNKTVDYNATVPTLDVSYYGFVNSDTSSVLDNSGFILSTTYTQGSTAGTYPINISMGTATDNNYNFTPLTGGVLTVRTPPTVTTVTPTYTSTSVTFKGNIGIRGDYSDVKARFRYSAPVLESPYTGDTLYEYKVNLHAHTNQSDGLLTPVQLMTQYLNEGYAATAKTDHDTYAGSNLDNPGVVGIIHLPGTEYSSGPHLGAVGISAYNNRSANQRQAQINSIISQGGIATINHPNEGWTNTSIMALTGFTHMEVWNARYPNNESYFDHALTNGRKILSTATDDFHTTALNEQFRGWVVIKTNIPQASLTATDILSCLKSGNYYCVGRAQNTHPTPPKLGVYTSGKRITLTTDKPCTLSFIRQNGVVAYTTNNVTTASYDMLETDIYIRTEATYSDGTNQSWAWGNPIYPSSGMGWVETDEVDVTSDAFNFSVTLNDKNIGDAGQFQAIITYNNGATELYGSLLDYEIPDRINITISASNQSKTYGETKALGTSAWTVTSGSYTTGDITSVTLSSTGSINTANAGAYNIVPSSASGPGIDKYNITYTNGTLTVGKKNLAVTTNNKSITYGSSNPMFDVSYSGFENGDTSVVLDNTGFSLISTYSIGNSVGTYTINISMGTATDNNYNFTPLNTGTLTVGKKDLVVTANDKTISYGSTSPAFDVSYSGFVNGDTSTTLDNTGFILSSTYIQGNAVGTYPINISVGSATDNNYTFTTLNVGTLTVTTRNITIKADNQSKTYGEIKTLGSTAFSVTTGSLYNVGDITGVTLSSTGTTSISNTGVYNIVPSNATGTNASSYNVTYTNGTLTVNKKDLSVTAENKNVTYGDTIPTLTVVYDGFVNGDTSTGLNNVGFVLGTTYSAGSQVSTYPISISIGSASDNNYNFTPLNAGQINVGTRGITITASDQSKIYGETKSLGTSEWIVTTGSLYNVSDITNVTLTSTASVNTANVGSYNIVPSNAIGSMVNNYSIGYSNGTLIVNKKDLSITANNKNVVYGSPIPSFDVSYTGFVNDDDSGDLDNTSFNITSPYTQGADVNEYIINITIGSATDNNYNFYPLNTGTLTVTKKDLIVTANNKSIVYGSVSPSFDVSYSGFVNGDDAGDLDNTSFSLTSAYAQGNGVNTYGINVSNGSAVDNNYNFIEFNSGILTVTPRSITITANDQSKIYGTNISLGTAEFTVTSGSLYDVNDVTSVILSSSGSGSVNDVGIYDIIPSDGSGLNSSNYIISYINGILTVNKKNIEVTANSKYLHINSPTPILDVTYTGFVNGDTSNDLDNTGFVLATTYTQGDGVGTYPITIEIGTATDNNYNFTQLNAGIITVSQMSGISVPIGSSWIVVVNIIS